MEKYAAIILAAGKGTRMNEGLASPIPKVMFKVGKEPVVYHSIKLLKDAGIDDVNLVVGYKKELIQDYFKDQVGYIIQDEQLGTGHAVKMGKNQLEGKSGAVITFYGDSPLYKPETVKKLVGLYEVEKPTIAMLSVKFDDPEFWAFGRLIRDGSGEVVIDIVEQKDCTPEQLKIKECNPGFYIFDAEWLWSNIDQLKNDNAQKEYYLTDMIKIAVSQGRKVIAMPVSEESEALGVNTQEQLKQAEEVLENRNS